MNLDRLFESLEALDGAVSTSTLRTYRRVVRSFAGVCATESGEIFPASQFNLLRWITSLSKTCRPVTIRGYLVSLRTVHSVMDWPWVGDAISIQHALRKQHRQYGSAQRQALGITHEMRDAMIDAIDTIDPSSLEGVMHRALVRTGYETLFRGVGLRALEVGDLSRRPRQRVCIFAVPTGSVFAKAAEFKGASDDLSRACGASGVLKRGSGGIGTHSMRVGCAQDMVRHGYLLAQIMRRGNWYSSEMVAR